MKNLRWLDEFIKRGGRIRSDTGAPPRVAGSDPLKKRAGQNTLEQEAQDKGRMVDLAGALLVRIRRQVHGRGLDDDNMSGGCKALRDAIAAALGRAGDSEGDGLRFDYVQEAAPAGNAKTIVEVYRDGEEVES